MMKSNNVVAAPMSASVGSLFEKWTISNPGTVRDFYKFLTEPSVQRSEFLATKTPYIRFSDNVAMRIY